MTVSVVKPHNVGNVSLVPMRKYALIGRPMHVFIDVYFKSEGSSLMASKNEYALSYIGQSIDDLADFVPSSTLGSQWRFEALKVVNQTSVDVHLLYDDGKVYFCADASKVDYIEFHTLDPGEVADIKSIDEINESSMIVLPPPMPIGITPPPASSGTILSPTPIASCNQTDTLLNPLADFTDLVSFHVILHEGAWTKMTILPKISNEGESTYPILIGIFNIKGDINNNVFRVTEYNSSTNLYPPTHMDNNGVLWLTENTLIKYNNIEFNETPKYYKISTERYCEFDVVVKNTGNIRKVVPPAIYSFWNIGQFSSLNLHTFTMRGHVFRTLLQNNEQNSGQCGCRQFAGVSIKMPSYNFGCSCDDGLGVEFSNSSNLKELHITTSDAVGVPGESVVFNIGDSTSPNLPATIQYFNTVGTYRHPLYGVSGNLNALSGFSNLIELRISYTSIHGNITYLPSMSNLQKVNLTNCDVEGDIYKFSGCTELKEMIAQLKDITGNLSSLLGLNKLVKINLSGSQVEGDISNLIYNTNLTELILPLQSISGNISSLSSLTKLVKINLSGSVVTDNISNLSTLTKLQSLNLGNSHVSGSVDTLTNLHKLTTINLNKCDVEGDLSKLPVSCAEFRANGNTTPFTWTSTNPRHDRNVTINNNTLDVMAISIPEEIVMYSSDDVENMLNDISLSKSISNGSIKVRVNNLSDSEFQNLKSFCQGILAALGLVGINALVLNGQTITNNN